MNRILLSTAILGLAAIPTFGIAQTDQTDGSGMQQPTETEAQSDTGGTSDAIDLDQPSGSATDTGTGQDSATGMGQQSPDGMSNGMGNTAADSTAPAQEGHSLVTLDTVAADQITGAPVRSRDGDDIADVSDVLMSEDGSVQSIIVDVGGVLGIGAKPVEVNFDQVTLQTNDDNGQMSVIIPMSRDQLESMPRYEES